MTASVPQCAPTHIQPVLQHLLDRLQQRAITQITTDTWRYVVGDMVASYSEPEQLENGQLTVRVAHPAQMYVLRLQEQRLLQRLQERVGKERVHALRFRVSNPS